MFMHAIVEHILKTIQVWDGADGTYMSQTSTVLEAVVLAGIEKTVCIIIQYFLYTGLLISNECRFVKVSPSMEFPPGRSISGLER